MFLGVGCQLEHRGYNMYAFLDLNVMHFRIRKDENAFSCKTSIQIFKLHIYGGVKSFTGRIRSQTSKFKRPR